ncbi:hypothetical protein [Paenibacillus oleatilyticus]|uniref:hypothetical protein n=1 Tax=Paenibacillus oleatilyticus TaxID=2594886 RepID=UPI001C1FD78B|nr:hypothetical protein [Paenibacillus oleatilyticus]MBU7319739.1 hypothetical protein [Paenibacillus oleatilyticus]
MSRSLLKKILTYIILFSFSCFVVSTIIKSIMPDYEFLVNSKLIHDKKVEVSTYQKNGLVKNMDFISDNLYHVSFSKEILKDELELTINFDDLGKIIKVTAEKNKMLVKETIFYDIQEKTIPNSGYEGFSVIKIGSFLNGYKFAITVFFSLLFCFFLALIFRKERIHILIYSPSILKYFNKYDVVLLILSLLVTFFLVVGVDAIGIYNALKINSLGLDIYQFQINKRAYTHFEYTEFAYNPSMLLGWTPIVYVWDLIFGNFNSLRGYPYFQIGIFKIMNLLFGLLTALSILSFLIDKKVISDWKKIKVSLYLSLFNPVFYYIAILFVQVDTLPMYLIIIGLLLMHKTHSPYLSVFVISLGLLTKLQLFLFYPVILITLLFIIFSEQMSFRLKIKRFCLSFLLHLSVLALFFVVPSQNGSPMYVFLNSFKQTERIWWTVVQYSPQLFLFLSIVLPLTVLLINYYFLHSKISTEKIIINGILLIGSLDYMFNFTIMHSPSILLHTTGAFVILYATSKDFVSKIYIFSVSLLSVFSYFFMDFGDISRIWRGWNAAPLFWTKIQSLGEGDTVKMISAVFTISNTAMLALGIIFLLKGVHFLKSIKKHEEYSSELM